MIGAHHGRTTFGRSSLLLASVLALALPVGACGDEEVSSEEDARLAYIALDGALAKTLTLGMDGFNAATSANIPDQMGTGDLMGTITVSGQVDMGASDNKGMRLNVELVDYQDMVIEEDETERMVIYDTDPAALPYVEITLRSIPTGTIAGTITGDFLMTGELGGVVTLNLSFSGMIQEDGSGGVERAPGTVQVTGTATSEYGTYAVDVTI